MRHPHTHAGWGDKALFAEESNPMIRRSLKADRVDMTASLKTTIESHNGTKGVNGLTLGVSEGLAGDDEVALLAEWGICSICAAQRIAMGRNAKPATVPLILFTVPM
jgi:hypothetical protein